jgi:hypothetical protein
MIDWVAREVQTVLNTIWQLNDNFAILAIEGVLNMLNNEGCQEFVTSSDAYILQDVPEVYGSWWGESCEGGGKLMAYLRLFASWRRPTP